MDELQNDGKSITMNVKVNINGFRVRAYREITNFIKLVNKRKQEDETEGAYIEQDELLTLNSIKESLAILCCVSVPGAEDVVDELPVDAPDVWIREAEGDEK